MDPLSITGMVITIGQILVQLHSYGAAADGFKEDAKILLQEASALKGILELLADWSKHGQKQLNAGLEAETKTMLEMTRDTLNKIERRFSAPRGRLGSVKRSLTWPFVKADFDRYISLLERSKTWFIASMMNDSSRLTQQIYADVVNLAHTIQQDIKGRKESELTERIWAITQQIAPILPDDDFAEFSQLRRSGSGR